jgi:hypothetical protein
MSSPALSARPGHSTRITGTQLTLLVLLVQTPGQGPLFLSLSLSLSLSLIACLERPGGVTEECLHDAALANVDPKQVVAL